MKNLLSQNNSLCLLIDVQEKLLPAIANKDSTLKSILFLLKGLNILNVPIIATEQYKKGLGSTIKEITSQTKILKTLEKNEFSAFLNPIIKNELTQQDKKQIVLIGIESHVCILQTAAHLHRHGYEVFIPYDCCSSRSEKNHENAMSRLQTEGITITNAESCLFEILESSSHPQFKEISQLIKAL